MTGGVFKRQVFLDVNNWKQELSPMENRAIESRTNRVGGLQTPNLGAKKIGFHGPQAARKAPNLRSPRTWLSKSLTNTTAARPDFCDFFLRTLDQICMIMGCCVICYQSLDWEWGRRWVVVEATFYSEETSGWVRCFKIWNGRTDGIGSSMAIRQLEVHSFFNMCASLAWSWGDVRCKLAVGPIFSMVMLNRIAFFAERILRT